MAAPTTGHIDIGGQQWSLQRKQRPLSNAVKKELDGIAYGKPSRPTTRHEPRIRIEVQHPRGWPPAPSNAELSPERSSRPQTAFPHAAGTTQTTTVPWVAGGAFGGLDRKTALRTPIWFGQAGLHLDQAGPGYLAGRYPQVATPLQPLAQTRSGLWPPTFELETSPMTPLRPQPSWEVKAQTRDAPAPLAASAPSESMLAAAAVQPHVNDLAGRVEERQRTAEKTEVDAATTVQAAARGKRAKTALGELKRRPSPSVTGSAMGAPRMPVRAHLPETRNLVFARGGSYENLYSSNYLANFGEARSPQKPMQIKIGDRFDHPLVHARIGAVERDQQKRSFVPNIDMRTGMQDTVVKYPWMS